MAAVTPDPELVETTTQLAVEEKGHLKKSLRRLDMVGFTVCALVGVMRFLRVESVWLVAP